MKKGGNAVGATREQPLGRASERNIGARAGEVKLGCPVPLTILQEVV
jgi:hypothetical protein